MTYKTDETKKAELAEKKTKLQKDMQDSVKELLTELKAGKSERLMGYLNFAAKFHNYSPLNQLMIAMQMPEATHVAGYTTWKRMGYQVAKGQKGIAILGPRPFTKVKKEEDGEEVCYQGISFKIVHVFDASQLEASDKPLPSFFTSLDGDHESLYTKISQAVKSSGIELEEGNTGQAQGWSIGGKIILKQGLDSTNRCLTLIHEFAHELLHQNATGKQMSKRKKELHAEAIAYIVGTHCGIKSPYSSDYIQNYGNTEKTLMEELTIIKTTAQVIIEKIETKESGLIAA